MKIGDPKELSDQQNVENNKNFFENLGDTIVNVGRIALVAIAALAAITVFKMASFLYRNFPHVVVGLAAFTLEVAIIAITGGALAAAAGLWLGGIALCGCIAVCYFGGSALIDEIRYTKNGIDFLDQLKCCQS